MQNFVFLLIIMLLQIVSMKIRIVLITIMTSLFGLVLAITVESEIGFPLFNIFVIFMCLANMYDYYETRPRG